MTAEHRFRIILVEDEPSIREVLTELLVDEGFECITAIDGMEATEKLQDNSFDVVISDLRMPRMTGTELLRWCRARNIMVPIIFISANKDLLPNEDLALAEASATILDKPIDFDHLIETVKSAIQNGQTLTPLI